MITHNRFFKMTTEYVEATLTSSQDQTGIMREDSKKHGIYLLKNYIYFYIFKLQSPSKYSPFDVIHLLRHFLHCSKHFELVDFDAFYCFCHFLFHLFYISKTFPFEDFFSSGETKNVMWGKIG